MEADAKYAWVGGAILGLVLAVIVAAVWLAQPGFDRFRTYTIYFQTLPLDGLAIGSDVEMRGVKVGAVEDYAISPANINVVRVVVRVDRRTPVSQNTVAEIDRNYVTRVARVALRTPGEPGPPLVAVPPGERHPVIPEGSSELAEVARTLRGLGEESAEVVASLRRLLDVPNQRRITATLENAEVLSASLRARVDELGRTLATIDRAAAELGRASGAIAVTLDRLGPEVGSAVMQARETLADVSRVATTLEGEGSRLASRLGEAADVSRDQIASTAFELRRSVAAIARAMEGLENPRAALTGPNEGQLGPGEQLR